MKAFLMYRDRDFDLGGALPANEAALRQDLELETLFAAMAAGDPFLLGVARQAVLTSLTDPEAIRYRQNILSDCLQQPDTIREMYAIAVEAVEREKKVYLGLFERYPDRLLERSVRVLEIMVELLWRLRRIADRSSATFHSAGMTTLFNTISTELDDAYLTSVAGHLRRLKLPDGVLLSAQLGKGNKGTRYVLRKPADVKRGWIERLLGDRSGYVYEVPDRDESGYRALSDLKGTGISRVAAVLGQSTEHVVSYFAMLRTELGFYVACLNLRERIARKGEPICFPDPYPAGTVRLRGRSLYDVCLSVTTSEKIVVNDVAADGKSLVMITGANRGGKSTFLRSIGVAQLMMQSGMFIGAEAYEADVCDGIFTHFKREEDAGMKSGKFDEELVRMSNIVDAMKPHSMALLNESFASTNEREGSEIARQIVRAFLDSGIKAIYVTHLFDLAHGFFLSDSQRGLFLRAERHRDGRRPFKLVEAEPLPTSYGEDLYRRIFVPAVKTAIGAPSTAGSS